MDSTEHDRQCLARDNMAGLFENIESVLSGLLATNGVLALNNASFEKVHGILEQVVEFFAIPNNRLSADIRSVLSKTPSYFLTENVPVVFLTAPEVYALKAMLKQGKMALHGTIMVSTQGPAVAAKR